VAAAVAAVVVLVVMFASLRTKRYVTADPRFCATACHHTRAPGGDWHANGHQAVGCQKCHEIPLKTSLALYWKSIVGSTPASHAKVEPKTCIECHDKRPAEWRLVDETWGHRQHRALKGVDCLSCHAEGTHKDTKAVATCANAGCHKAERLHQASTADAESCVSCHSFAVSAKHMQQPTTTACEACHDGTKPYTKTESGAVRPMKEVNELVLHGDVACQLCHNAHGLKPKAPPGQPVCARCHQLEIWEASTPEAQRGPKGHWDCEKCHQPHAPLRTALDQCVKCHEKNSKGFVGDGKTPLPAAAGSARKTTALKHSSCASCHQPHSWRAQRSGCVQCHAQKAELVRAQSPEQHGSCINCHEVHGPAPTGAVCLKCHDKTRGSHVALAPEKHKSCVACHDPHAPRAKDTRSSCAKCHATQLTQVMRDGPDGHAKNSCFGCHKPHESPAAPPDLCAKCHADKAKLVASAGPAKHKSCASCHERHVFKVKDPQATCLACHGPSKPGVVNAKASGAPLLPAGGAHQGDCKKCHAPHGSPNVPKSACFKCHDKLEAGFKAPNEQHATCRSCHTPHTAASAAGAKCATCHAPKVAVAAKWPVNSAHAQACNKCHSQHDVKTKKACSTCHAAEATSAIGGKHQCTQCHAPHTAPPGTGAAWWSRCNECHAAKVESAKLRGKTHSECKNCHQTHKFAVPTCLSCHKDMSTKGLHAVEKHAAACNKCHDPHVKSEPERAQCLACHANRAAHQPDAKKCQACHVFK
jgi:hypothetical protein